MSNSCAIRCPRGHAISHLLNVITSPSIMISQVVGDYAWWQLMDGPSYSLGKGMAQPAGSRLAILAPSCKFCHWGVVLVSPVISRPVAQAERHHDTYHGHNENSNSRPTPGRGRVIDKVNKRPDWSRQLNKHWKSRYDWQWEAQGGPRWENGPCEPAMRLLNGFVYLRVLFG